MDVDGGRDRSIVISELYFLITKFLSHGDMRQIGEHLIKELEKHNVLPKRVDWTGQQHDQTFAELEKKYPKIGPQHLLDICCRISPLLDKEIQPSVRGVASLLGAGRQSLLRTSENVTRPKTLTDHVTRFHSMPLMDSTNSRTSFNTVQVLFGRESSGPIGRRTLIPPTFYRKQNLLRCTLGHLSSVYCVLFDRTGKFIITGADDLLVKLWSAIDGRLLVTFRGASAEITDIAVNLENSLLAAGSLDRILRVWDLQTAGPIAVLTGHTGMITSVNFCPSVRGDMKYLVTTSTDGSVAFWLYTAETRASGAVKVEFAVKPIQFLEKLRPGQAQMICGSFSPGGIFLAAGSADHHVRVYLMGDDGPKRILEVEAHTDTVDSIQWAHAGLRFISGGKDGIAFVWHFESQQWKSMQLNMTQRLPTCPVPEEDAKKLKVTMVSWDFSDKWVMTAVSDASIKVWNSTTGVLHKVLRGHTDEIYVLESHPLDPHVLLSAGHDGQLFLWDILTGEKTVGFKNHIEGQGDGGIFDAKWSPDGTMIAATDSHGHILIFGFGNGNDRLKKLPKELFFHTDYRPLARDAMLFVMDEQTQTAPHLMPPPFLVDVDGNPYPPVLQRLVPGRELCPCDQLTPNIAVGPGGVEVVEDSITSHLDRLIEALASRRGEIVLDLRNDPESLLNNRVGNSPRSNSHRLALRRTGDVEGVRQSSGNWQRDSSFKWLRRIYVPPLRAKQYATFKIRSMAAIHCEIDQYRREMRRRPLMINTSIQNSLASTVGRPRGRTNRRGQATSAYAYRTRAVREREHVEEAEPDDENVSASSSSAHGESSDESAAEEDLVMSSSSDEDSTDYSDWVAEPGTNLEPPKRSKRKLVQNRAAVPGDSVRDKRAAAVAAARRRLSHSHNENDIPELYRPSEWLSLVRPHKAPYWPQMGDDVVYFKQGHNLYNDVVREKKMYPLAKHCEPWVTMELRAQEMVKVVGIKYEIRPPRLCCLKLAMMDDNGQLTGQSFTVKYHDVQDVLDFFVLQQQYQSAVNRNWGPGDRFRCMIDESWWVGEIVEQDPHCSSSPESLFMCFRVRWDNGEFEKMSPWDMEPIDDNRLPPVVGGAVRVLPEEFRQTLYHPKPEEWPRGDRDASCRRILNGLEQVMGLAIAEPFMVPVDLNTYPTYALVVEYPIDLTTIVARFENNFYRRITSAQFDVRYLATNAEKFNQPHSQIIKHARIITDLCLRILKDTNEVDVGAVYHQLVDTYNSSDSEHGEDQPGPSTGDRSEYRRSKRLKIENDWRVNCRELLEVVWQCDDSSPFREPVDTIEHPDYLQIVDSPMDLRTIKEDLLGGNYETPTEFAKDVRLIFTNSKNFNTNKRSRIYSMTLRLSTLFETHIKPIIYHWKSHRRRTQRGQLSAEQDGGGAGPSTMRTRKQRNGTNNAAITIPGPQTYSSGGTDDDDDDDEDSNQMRTRNGRLTARRYVEQNSTTPAPSTANGMLQSSSMQSNPQPGPSRGFARTNSNDQQDQQGHTDDVDVDSSESSNNGSNSSDDGSDESGGLPLAALSGNARQRRSAAKRPLKGYDSEDSYKPNRRATEKPKKRKIGRKKRKHNRHDRSEAGPSSGSRFSRTSRRATRSQSEEDVSDNDSLPAPIVESAASGSSRRRRDENEDINTVTAHDLDGRQTMRTKRRIERVSVSAQQQQPAQQRPNTRNTTDQQNRAATSTDDDDDETDRTRNKRQRYESDHSYHLDDASGRQRMRLESDTENDNPRPTRSSIKKAQEAWGREEDSLEDEPTEEDTQRGDDDSESDNDDDNAPLSRFGHALNDRARHTAYRLFDDSDDDQPVNGNNRTRSNHRKKDIINPNALTKAILLNDPRNSTRTTMGTALGTTTSTQRTRQVYPSTNNRSQRTTSASETRRNNQSHVQQFHNYGEPGPSSMRHRRQIVTSLSRHQRNASELDPRHDENSQNNASQSTSSSNVLPISTISSRLRLRNTTTTTASNGNGNVRSSPSRRTGMPAAILRRNGVSEPEENEANEDGEDEEEQEEENEEEEEDEDNQKNIEDGVDEEDDDYSDSDDNKPLRQVAMATIVTARTKYRRRPDDSDEDEDDEDDSGPSTGRSTRNLKRMRYNEDSDESNGNGGGGCSGSQRKRGLRTNNSNSIESATAPHRQSSTSLTRSAAAHTNHNSNSSNNRSMNSVNDELSEAEIAISISSRGRVRKLTAKARGLLRD